MSASQNVLMRSPRARHSHMPQCRNSPISAPPHKSCCIKSPFASTQRQATFQIIQIFSLLFFVLDPYNGIPLCPRRALAVPDCSQRRVRRRRLPRRQNRRPLSMVIERNGFLTLQNLGCFDGKRVNMIPRFIFRFNWRFNP